MLNEMAQRALTTSDLQIYAAHNPINTASMASMRSRTPVDGMDRPFTPPDGDGGNVKVVVRVRKFIRRGTDDRLLLVEHC